MSSLLKTTKSKNKYICPGDRISEIFRAFVARKYDKRSLDQRSKTIGVKDLSGSKYYREEGYTLEKLSLLLSKRLRDKGIDKNKSISESTIDGYVSCSGETSLSKVYNCAQMMSVLDIYYIPLVIFDKDDNIVQQFNIKDLEDKTYFGNYIRKQRDRKTRNEFLENFKETILEESLRKWEYSIQLPRTHKIKYICETLGHTPIYLMPLGF